LTVAFSPVWITPQGSIGETAEGATFAFDLTVEVRASIPVVAGQTEITIGTAASAEFVEARFSGATLAASVVADIIVVDPISGNGIVDVVIARDVTFGLLNGTPAPNVIVSANGVVSGVVGEVTPTSEGSYRDYQFTVRAEITDAVRDRTFIMRSFWNDSPPSWALDPVPPLEGGRYRIAPPDESVVLRGTSFTYAFRATDPDSLPPPADISGSLPDGLRYNRDGRRIDGVVALEATLGTYPFTLTIAPDDSLDFFVEVAPRDPDLPLAPPLTIGWVTPTGSLGTLRDDTPCPFGVEAITTTGDPVSYELVSGAGSLPPGLSLDEDTGHVYGISTGGSGTYTFAIRARVDATFEDRIFSITITSVYSASALTTLFLSPPGPAGTELIAIYADALPDSAIFRLSSADPHFGLPSTPMIYLIGGMNADDAALASATSAEAGENRPESGTHQWVRLVLGAHKVYAATSSSGAVRYEVLVRELYDPLALAGGFTSDGQADPIYLPDDENVALRVPSLTNIRYDLIADVGFATIAPTLRRRAWVTGGESVPVWLRGTSTFTPVLPVAYLKPGKGEEMLALIDTLEDDVLPRNGITIDFSGYAVRRVTRPDGVIETGFVPLSRPFG